MASKRNTTRKKGYQTSRPAPSEFAEPEGTLEPSFTPPPRPTQEAERIGDILRRVREYHGEELETISEHLCIKPAYLFAIEESQYEKLPADAYVIGFLRTYALYLGLDGRAAIDQYRREMAGRRKKPQLSMPQPISEGRAPTIAVLIGTAVAALLLYGLWYGLSSPDEEIMQQPVPLPQVQSEASPVTITPTPLTDVVAQPPTLSSSGIPISTSETTTTDDAIVIPSNVPADKPDNQPAAKAAPQSLTEPEASQKEKPAEPQSRTPEPQTLQQEKSELALTPTSSVQPKPADAAQPPKEETAKPVIQEPEKKEMIFGAKRKARISLRVEKPTWILITDSRGLTVFDRTLKPGETYNVPEGQDLRLTTASAGDIRFAIDGKTYPKMDSGSQVVRAMTLDTSALKNRLSTSTKPRN
ncbi:MAG: DUF4115 domain-containing protein [Alphaproteobacteria bacterium]|jgi:cytoskeletal protein RodZ|nr:DUF4115 domain-containing protein [Alphaproteobacteria bacterium]